MDDHSINKGNDSSEGNTFPFSTLPMDLQMFAMSLNMINLKLLTIRANRTRYTVDTAQAIMDGNTENIDKQYGKMFAPNTLNKEWKKLEEIEAEIDTTVAESMHLFEAANTELKKVDKSGVNFALLHLPDEKFAELRNTTDTENIYDHMSEYNDILNNFLYKLIEYCGKLGMALLRV